MSPPLVRGPIFPTVVELIAARAIYVGAHIGSEISEYMLPMTEHERRRVNVPGDQLTSKPPSLGETENKL